MCMLLPQWPPVSHVLNQIRNMGRQGVERSDRKAVKFQSYGPAWRDLHYSRKRKGECWAMIELLTAFLFFFILFHSWTRTLILLFSDLIVSSFVRVHKNEKIKKKCTCVRAKRQSWEQAIHKFLVISLSLVTMACSLKIEYTRTKELYFCGDSIMNNSMIERAQNLSSFTFPFHWPANTQIKCRPVSIASCHETTSDGKGKVHSVWTQEKWIEFLFLDHKLCASQLLFFYLFIMAGP